VFGAVSVILYKPWRRHVEKKRLQKARFVPVPETGDDDAEAGSLSQSVAGKPTKDSGEGMHVDVTAVHTEGQQGSSRIDTYRMSVANVTQGRADQIKGLEQ
jgi:high-affinity nickel-transport protein